MDKIKLEVCCGSAEDVIEAYKAGADRVELNSNLFHGGLTPTLGSLLVAKSEADFPIMTMIRPREGGFCYTETEFRVAVADAKLMVNNGSDGLVFGFLRENGTVDMERSRIIAEIAQEKGLQTVFHRAVDVVPDWKEALDMLIELKITRVLTSGQCYDVSYAVPVVKAMIEYAAGRIEILPGAGLTNANVRRFVEESGCTQVHMAAHRLMFDTSTANNRSIFYGGCLYPPEDRFNVTDGAYIGNVVSMLGGR